MLGRGQSVDRVVIGGGLFGCYAAISLADRGHQVVLIEQAPDLLTRASLVNQARLHSGLHYPRSFLTATEALRYYRQFRLRFPEAVRDFEQIYAVARHNSKTRGSDFSAFIERLGLYAEEIDPERWFHRGTVSRAFRVEEPSFDAGSLRDILVKELDSRPNVRVLVNKRMIAGTVGPDEVVIELDDGTFITGQRLVLSVYAGTNAARRSLGLPPLPLTFELAEVVLGRVDRELRDVGFTVMDGPFWSLMPFGHSDQVSLTSVGLTPLRKSRDVAVFPCQDLRDSCDPDHLQDCNWCPVRPASAVTHHQQQMALFLRRAASFTPTDSLYTVKAVLSSTEVDDARPTLIHQDPDLMVTTVFSGKVSTLFDLDKELR